MVELGEIEIATTIFNKFDVMSVNLKEDNYKRWLELDKILNDPACRDRIQKDYAELRSILQSKGNASKRAADIIVHLKDQ